MTDIDYVLDHGLNKKQMNVVREFLKKNTYSKIIKKEKILKRMDDYYRTDFDII